VQYRDEEVFHLVVKGLLEVVNLDSSVPGSTSYIG